MRSKTLLLVEDNPDDVELTLRAFAKHGIANQIVVARDGLEALSLLHGSAPNAEPGLVPELVLLDLNLPLLNGHEVLRRLRADPRTRRIPVVVLSADASPGQIDRLMMLGADAYLTKPIDLKEFYRVLERVLQK